MTHQQNLQVRQKPRNALSKIAGDSIFLLMKQVVFCGYICQS